MARDGLIPARAEAILVGDRHDLRLLCRIGLIGDVFRLNPLDSIVPPNRDGIACLLMAPERVSDSLPQGTQNPGDVVNAFGRCEVGVRNVAHRILSFKFSQAIASAITAFVLSARDAMSRRTVQFRIVLVLGSCESLFPTMTHHEHVHPVRDVVEFSVLAKSRLGEGPLRGVIF